MNELTKFDDIIEVADFENIVLGEDEFMLKIHGDLGFMAKKTKNNSVPTSFSGWRGSWRNTGKQIENYVITEKFRTGWRFVGLRHEQSTAWVILRHPFGFTIENNPSAFQDIVEELTMVNGLIVTPCYFFAKMKNAKIHVEKNDSHEYILSLVNAVYDDQQLIEQIRTMIEDNRPDKVYSVISQV